jgi:hypothetical protein
MADRVYSPVKGPARWVLFLDGARVGGIYGTKEAAFEAVMVAASFVVGLGDRSDQRAKRRQDARHRQSRSQKKLVRFSSDQPSRPSGTDGPRRD